VRLRAEALEAAVEGAEDGGLRPVVRTRARRNGRGPRRLRNPVHREEGGTLLALALRWRFHSLRPFAFAQNIA